MRKAFLLLGIPVLAVAAVRAAATAQNPSADSSASQPTPSAEGLQGLLPATAPDLLADLPLLKTKVEKQAASGDWRGDVATAQSVLAKLFDGTRSDAATPLTADAQKELLDQMQAVQLRIRDSAAGVEGELAAELRVFRYRLWRRRMLLEATFQAMAGRAESLEQALTDDRRELTAGIKALRQSLGGTANGDAWLRYLQTEQIETLVRSPDSETTPEQVAALAERFDPARVEPTQRQVLQRTAVTHVRDTLRGYAAHLRERDPALAEKLRQNLRELWARVEQYESDSSLADAAGVRELGRSVAIYGSGGQHVAEVLLDTYRQPNVWVGISRALASRFLPGPQRERGPVQMLRGGTYVSGQQETRATPRLRFYEARPAAFAFELPGTVDTYIVASQGQADVAASVRTTFLARRRIEVTGDGLRAGPPQIDARASSNVQGADVRGTLFPGIARQRAAEIGQQALNRSEPETERRVEREVLDRFNPEVEKFVERTNKRIEDLRKRHDEDRDVLDIETRSTQDWLLLSGTLSDTDDLGAWSPRLATPPDTLGAADVHETAVNNALDRSDLPGATYTREELRDKLRDAVTSVADVWKEKESKVAPERELTITFAQERPVRVRLRDGVAELVLRATRLEGASFKVGPRQVRVRYRPILDAENLRLVRDGEIGLEPLEPSAAGEADAASLAALREVLEDIFPAESVRSRTFDASSDDEETSSADRKAIPLRLLNVDILDGWLAAAVGD